MRNLLPIDDCDVTVGNGDSQVLGDGETAQALCPNVLDDLGAYWMATNKRLICVTRSGRLDEQVALEEVFPSVECGQLSVCALDYMPDAAALCVITRTGHITTVLVGDVDLSHKCEDVGNVPDGISGSAWSPDMCTLAVVSPCGQLVLLTADFDVLLQCDVQPQGRGADDLVTVGWGKKETQFQGSAGKRAAFARPDSPTRVHSWDACDALIAWRADGAYFAVSAPDAAAHGRTVRVWTRDGEHSTTLHTLAGIEPVLAWRPSGEWLCVSAVKQCPSDEGVERPRRLCALYERNGMARMTFDYHGGCDAATPGGGWRSDALAWSHDSSMLAAAFSQCSHGDTHRTYVDIYTISNWRWCLKHRNILPSHSPVVCLQWIAAHNIVMALCRDGTCKRLAFAWTTHREEESMCSPVVVIDGARLKVTRFGRSAVPPPMCEFELQLDQPATLVALRCRNSATTLAAVTCHADYLYVFADLDADVVALPSEFKLSEEMPAATHLCWLTDHSLIACSQREKQGDTELLLIRLDSSSETAIVRREQFKGRLHCIVPIQRYRKSAACLAVQDSGDCYLVEVNASEDSAVDSCTLAVSRIGTYASDPPACIDAATTVCAVAKDKGGGDSIMLLMLTHRFQLYASLLADGGLRLLSKNVNSMCVRADFLIVTTLDRRLLCVPIERLFDQSVTWLSAAAAGDVGRSVERGSQLVAACGNTTGVLLQMPRGNLETVHPRVLTVNRACQLLSASRHRAALLLMKRHRINMNLAYDIDPQKFVRDVSDFIEQLDDPSLLNLFLAELMDENVTQTLYKDALMCTGRSEVERSGAKCANDILDMVRTQLDRVLSANAQHSRKWMPSLMVTFTQKAPPELEHALGRVAQFMQSAPDAESTVEACLRQLEYACDSTKLYKYALTTHNFDLVLALADRSQMDPKEYVPFLNELRRLPPDYMKFTIEMHLDRPQHALKHLAKCADDRWDELVAFVQKHNLYHAALGALASDTDVKRMSLLYGDALARRHRHSEAALVYSRAAAWHRAGDMCIACMDVHGYLMAARNANAATDCGASAPRVDTHAGLSTIAAMCADAGKHANAAAIYDTLLADGASASACYSLAGDWLAALRTDQSGTEQRALARCTAVIEQVRTCAAEAEKHAARLAEVRQRKMVRLKEIIERGSDDTQADAAADLWSESSVATTSAHSGVSGRSKASAAKRTSAQQQARRLRLKAGSHWEDLALLNAIADAVAACNAVQEELCSLLRALWLLGQWSSVEQLQRMVAAALHTVDKAVCASWPDQWLPHLLPGPLEKLFDGEIPAEGAMPKHIEIEPQMVRPQLRMDKSWMLHIV